MPNQFKCNDNNATPQEKIDSFNAVYDYYYDNKSNGAAAFSAPIATTNNGKYYNGLSNGQTWANKYCGSDGCPSNIAAEVLGENLYFTTVNGGNKVLNSDLAKYLDKCAEYIVLDNNAPYYGSASSTTEKRYPQTTTLRDVSYNNLLDDRNDLDRKMKEVLALQGSMVNEHQNMVDGSVYTTLLWTVMATSLVYYVFTKI